MQRRTLRSNRLSHLLHHRRLKRKNQMRSHNNRSRRHHYRSRRHGRRHRKSVSFRSFLLNESRRGRRQRYAHLHDPVLPLQSRRRNENKINLISRQRVVRPGNLIQHVRHLDRIVSWIRHQKQTSLTSRRRLRSRHRTIRRGLLPLNLAKLLSIKHGLDRPRLSKIGRVRR